MTANQNIHAHARARTHTHTHTQTLLPLQSVFIVLNPNITIIWKCGNYHHFMNFQHCLFFSSICPFLFRLSSHLFPDNNAIYCFHHSHIRNASSQQYTHNPYAHLPSIYTFTWKCSRMGYFSSKVLEPQVHHCQHKKPKLYLNSPNIVRRKALETGRNSFMIHAHSASLPFKDLASSPYARLRHRNLLLFRGISCIRR